MQGFYRLARYLAAWQILTPRDTITWVRDQMKLPPVKFLRLTHLTHLIYQNLLIFYNIIIVSKICLWLLVTGFYRLARSIAAWQILTPRDTITWVRDQMILPPVKFLRLTQLTYFIYQNLFIFNEIITVSKIWKHRWKAYKISDFLVPKTKKVKFFRNFLIIWR